MKTKIKKVIINLLSVVMFSVCKILIPLLFICFLAAGKILYIDPFFTKFLGFKFAGAIVVESLLVIVSLYVYRYCYKFIKFRDFVEKFPGKNIFSYTQHCFGFLPEFLKNYFFFNIILFTSHLPLEAILDSIITWFNKIFAANIEFDISTYLQTDGLLYNIIFKLVIIKYSDPNLFQNFVNFWYAVVFIVCIFAYKNRIDFDIEMESKNKVDVAAS